MSTATRNPEIVGLYRPEAALDRPPADLEEAWTSGVPDALHYNSWIADRAVEFPEHKVVPSSPLGKAMSYLDHQWAARRP